MDVVGGKFSFYKTWFLLLDSVMERLFYEGGV